MEFSHPLIRKVPHVVTLWRSSLAKVNKRVSDAILGPQDSPENFPDFENVSLPNAV